MPYFYSMMLSRTDELTTVPSRIISLVPSQTELLFHLGLDHEVAGITKFCIHPAAWFRSKTRVGGTKNLQPGIIHQLQPDLIIANKEENTQEQVEALANDFPVWVTDVNNLNDALQMINDIGELTGRQTAAGKLHTEIILAFDQLQQQQLLQNKHPRTAYLIWRDPWMTVGGDTFIHDMLQRCGCINVFAHLERYPQTSIAALAAAGCELLFLSSEPYPFKQQHIDELQSRLPGTRIILVDGEMFSWYGSRLLKAVDYFKELMKLIG